MMAAGGFTEAQRRQPQLPAIAGGRLNVPANSNIQAVWRLNEIELRHNIEGEASWHWQHRNSSYIYIGGLDVRLTEGDIIVVFSQWGEPVDIHLVRDKRTGVPKGFAFLAYEDQRSTILAVDNANGMQLLQRTLRVDHCKDYRPPERQLQQGEEEGANGAGSSSCKYEATGAEGKGLGVYGVTQDQRHRFAAEKQAQQLLRQNRLQETERAAALQRQGLKDVDEMWCEEFEEMLKQANKEAEAEAQQLLEAEAAKKRQQKELEKQAKKAWKKEWKQQRAAEKQERHESGDDATDTKRRKRLKKEEKKKHKRRGAHEEERERLTDKGGYEGYAKETERSGHAEGYEEEEEESRRICSGGYEKEGREEGERWARRGGGGGGRQGERVKETCRCKELEEEEEEERGRHRRGYGLEEENEERRRRDRRDDEEEEGKANRCRGRYEDEVRREGSGGREGEGEEKEQEERGNRRGGEQADIKIKEAQARIREKAMCDEKNDYKKRKLHEDAAVAACREGKIKRSENDVEYQRLHRGESSKDTGQQRGTRSRPESRVEDEELQQKEKGWRERHEEQKQCAGRGGSEEERETGRHWEPRRRWRREEECKERQHGRSRRQEEEEDQHRREGRSTYYRDDARCEKDTSFRRR